MAIGSVSATSRSVSVTEALRAPTENRRTQEQQQANQADTVQRLLQSRVNEERRTSRENKDNGNNTADLYQAPSVKQSLPANKAVGTTINVTA